MPSAQLLADYVSVIQDLKFVQECCRRILNTFRQPEGERDLTLLKALWSAALVAYSRCFGTGKRFGLQNEDVKKLPLQGEVIEFHKWLRNMREKYVAHSVNPFEMVKVGAMLPLPGQPQREVQGIATLGMYYLLPDETGVWQLGGIAAGLAKLVAEKAEAQQQIVLEEVRRLDIEDLYRLPNLQTIAPGPDDAGRGRPKNAV